MIESRFFHVVLCCIAMAGCVWDARSYGDESLAVDKSRETPSLEKVVADVQLKMVKIYGAGAAGLEAYHSGFLISAEGHILTAWSYVLDTKSISVTLADGRRRKAELVGIDPQLEIAVIKIPGEMLPYFDLQSAIALETGDPILAFSNLYGVAVGDEAVSVQQGLIAGRLNLAAKRGGFATPYRGEVYLLDAVTNNPGAAGGVLTDRQGRFAGVLGKELRHARDSTWLNFSLPAAAVQKSAGDILAGKIPASRLGDEEKRPAESYTASDLGVELVPDIVANTPPFIDRVVPLSPAAVAGLKEDDLILFVNGKLVASCRAVVAELSFADRLDPVRLSVQRGQEIVEVTLRAASR